MPDLDYCILVYFSEVLFFGILPGHLHTARILQVARLRTQHRAKALPRLRESRSIPVAGKRRLCIVVVITRFYNNSFQV